MADSTPHGPGVAFGRIAAAVPVSDISRALGFYRDILGMSVTAISRCRSVEVLFITSRSVWVLARPLLADSGADTYIGMVARPQ